MSFTVALLAAAAPIVPMSNSETPTAVVERLLEANAKDDWPTALAMLTTDAEFGMGDVGGPLNKETVSIFGWPGCRITSMRETAQRVPVFPNVRFVEVKRMCPYGAKSSQSGEHELVVTYFVKGKKISGFYLDTKPAPPHP